MRRLLGITLLAALLCVPVAQAHPPKGHPPQVQPVASGLDSPRHLAFDWRGNLYVAEAGEGGSGPCFVGGEGPACMGDSGAVTKIPRRGVPYRVADHLASYANVNPPNTNAIGPHGITVIGDQVFVTNGGPTEPKVTPTGPTISRDELAAQNPAADLFGWLLRLRRHGQEPQKIADLWAFERDVNPDKAGGGNPAVDSNPVDVLFDGRRFVVADAGGNAINVVKPFSGRISNLTVFPNRPGVPGPGGPVDMQAVPTSVVMGPDHQYYVSQLTGFPFPVGGANVYRVDPRTGQKSIAASGFTNIMDLAFGPDGTLYVLEIDHDGLLTPTPNEGAIFAIDKRGRQRQIQLPAGSLPMPGGIAVGRDGLYVTINSGQPNGGAVVRIRP